MTHFPAQVKNKAVVTVSSCPLHPKYQALRLPRATQPECTCPEIWASQQRVKELLR